MKKTRMRINSKVIESLKPCQDRFYNWINNYEDFAGSVSEFFQLTKITHEDKLWVVLRLVSNETKVVFALDCSFAAYAATATAVDAAAYATATAYAAAYNAASVAATAAAYASVAATAAAYASVAATAAAYASVAATAAATTYTAAYATATAAADAAYATTYAAEQSRQLESLLYLIRGES